MKSLLFVPADSERKQAKAAGADALALDLETSKMLDVPHLKGAQRMLRSVAA